MTSNELEIDSIIELIEHRKIKFIEQSLLESIQQRVIDQKNVILYMQLVEEFGGNIHIKTSHSKSTLLHLFCSCEAQIFVEFVIKFVDQLGLIVNEQDILGNTPICLAITCDNKVMVELLLSMHGIDLYTVPKNDENQKMPPLHHAVLSNRLEIVELLVRYDKNLTGLSIGKTGVTSVDIAIACGFMPILRYLVDIGDANLKRIFPMKQTILHLIANYTHSTMQDIIEYLLYGPQNISELINARDDKGNTPIHYATLFQNFLYYNALAKHPNTDKCIVNYNNYTPLLTLLHHSHNPIDINFVHKLLTHHSNAIEIRGNDGLTALMKSIILERVDIIKAIIEIGKAKVNDIYNKNNNLIHILLYKDIFDEIICDYIIYKANKMINKCNEVGYTPLHLAAIRGNYVVMKVLLKFNKEDVLRKTPKGDNCLFLAIKAMCDPLSIIENNCICIKILLELKNIHLVNCLDGAGQTPLAYAYFYNFKTVVQMLLENDAAVNYPMKDSRILLHVVAECLTINNDLLDLTFEYCTDINMVDNNDLAPIHIAVANKNYKFLEKILLNPHLEIDRTNIFSFVDFNDFKDDILKLIFDKCPDWMLKSEYVFKAVVCNNFIAVKMFSKRNFGVQFIHGNTTILHVISLEKTSSLIVDFIINELKKCTSREKCKIINYKNNNGNTALMYAAYTHNLYVLNKLLIFEETNVKLQNSLGATALLLSLNAENKKFSPVIIKKLIKADKTLCNIPDINGRVSLEKAILLKRIDVVKLLVDDGGSKLVWGEKSLMPLDIIADFQVLCPKLFKYFFFDKKLIISECNRAIYILYQRPLLFKYLFESIENDEIEHDFYSHELFNLLKTEKDEMSLQDKIKRYISIQNISDLCQIKDNLNLGFLQRLNMCGYFRVSKNLYEYYKINLTEIMSLEKCRNKEILQYFFDQTNIAHLVNQEGLYKRTLLHSACEEINDVLLMYLLGVHECNVLCQDFLGRTGLHLLLFNAKKRCSQHNLILNMIEQVLIKDVNILFLPDIYGVYPIEIVIIEKQVKILNLIISYNPEVLFHLDKHENNLLHIMAYSIELQYTEEMLIILLKNYKNLHKVMAMQNIDGDTPLHLFCSKGKLAPIKTLQPYYKEIKQAFMTKNHKEETVLASSLHKESCVNIDLVNLLLNIEPNLVNEADEVGNTPLHKAIILQRADIINQLFLKLADPDLINFDENTILHFASMHSVEEKLIDVIHNDPWIKIEGPYRDFAFLSVETDSKTKSHYIKTQNLECQKRVLHLVNRTNIDGNTALHLALIHKNITHIKRLLTYESLDMTIVNSKQESPLFLAVSCDLSLEIVEKILRKDLSMMDVPNKDGLTPSRKAIERNRSDLNNLFFLFGAKSQAAFEEYTLLKNISYVTNLTTDALFLTDCSEILSSHDFSGNKTSKPMKISKLVNQLSCDRNKNAPIAYFTRNIDKYPSSVNETCNKYGDYLIYLSIEWNRRDIFKYLTDFGCGQFIESNEESKKNALHIFAEMSDIDPTMLDVLGFYLKQSHHLINKGDLNGNTPLHLAAKCDNLFMIKTLLNLNADKKMLNNANQTPLLYALYENTFIQAKTIELLFDHNISKMHDSNYRTPLIKAMEIKRMDIIEKIFELDENSIFYNDSFQNNVFHYVSLFKIDNEDVIKLLLKKIKEKNKVLKSKKKFNYDTPNNYTGDTPIHLAAQANNLKLLKLLMPKTSGPYKKNYNEETPLLATLNPKNLNVSFDVVAFLIKKNPRTLLERDCNGLLAIHKVMKLNNWHIFELLMTYDKESRQQLMYLDNHKNTILHHLVLQNVSDLNIFEYIVKSPLQQQINEKNVYDETFLHLLMRQESEINIKQLEIVLIHTKVDLTIHYKGHSILMLLLKNEKNFTK
uniref:CSON003131 protein n=1 Tax=Culicoides sonorensis TaxID=179676 RepID=A0A336L243_CULSO